jgi:DNA invertase Pin-like site-specific DNA recombinase
VQTHRRRAVAYLRCNDGNATKIEAQREAIICWAMRAGVEVASWHQDLASGLAPRSSRLRLNQAITELETGRAALLLIARPETLTRSVSAMVQLIDEVLEFGAQIVFTAV